MSLSCRASVQGGALSLAAPAFFHRSAAVADHVHPRGMAEVCKVPVEQNGAA